MKRRFRLLLAAAFAALAVVLGIAYGDSVRAETESERAAAMERYGGETASVLVATEALETGAVLGTASLEVRTWPSELVPDGALGSVEDALGESLAHPLSAGAAVTETVLASHQEGLSVPSGHAALTVAVGERTGVSGDVAAGTVLAAYRVQDGACRLICGSARVLAAAGDSLTVAVPAENVGATVTAASDGSLRLVVPAADVDALDTGAAAGDVLPADEGAGGAPDGGETSPVKSAGRS